MGGKGHPYFRDVFAAYPVRNLPPPHGPFKCAHTDRYDTILDSLEDHGGDYMDRNLQAGSILLQSLTSSDLATCSTYHRANWHAIADESVAIITELGIRDDKGDYQKATKRRLRGKERDWLFSLFWDPIVISDRSYTDGQHRGCALRFSGAQRAAVVVDTEETGEFEYPWTYLGDG